jgi:hypothetical protein
MATERPDLAAVREYLRVPATALSDVDLARMMATCASDQDQRCAYPADTYPDPLAQAWLRRIQREVAGRNLPLGLVGLEAEYGPTRVPALDALVDEHERGWRRVVLA